MSAMSNAGWPRDALPRGTMLHGFELVGFLGRGGFGITYRAVDRIRQQFAIKECFPRQFAMRDGASVVPADDEFHGGMFQKCLDGFTKEALALTLFSKNIRDDGVIRVVTSFEINGTAYIVMDYAEGRSLEQLIEASPDGLPEATLRPILRHLSATLACVHGNGLLHRDIKPANVILRADGRPMLLDFGAARAVRADGPAPSQIFTASYAPIEQIEGRLQGPFSDLYSLGVTCYQAIAGARFADAPSSQARYQALLLKQPDPLFSAARLGQGRYGDRLLRAIDLLLHVQPEDRPQSVGQFLPHLDERDAGRPDPEGTRLHSLDADTAIGRSVAPTMVRPTVGPTASASSSQRTRRDGDAWFAMLGIVLLLLAAGIGGGVYLYAGRDEAAPKSASVPDPKLEIPANPGLVEGKFIGTDKNRRDALRDYQAGAAAGDSEAEYHLGMLYQLGEGVRADPVLAMHWYRKSAAQHYSPAQARIGSLYLTGFGVPRDYGEASRWFRLAAGQDNAGAQFQMGYMAQYGFGTPKDYPAALRWYQQAAQQGSAVAHQQMGFLYQKGLGTPVDPGQALSHYRAAAEAGLPAAQFNLGLIYADGAGVARNPMAAREWIGKAAAGGNAGATAWLASHPPADAPGRTGHAE